MVAGAGRKRPFERVGGASEPARIAGVGALLLSAVLIGVGAGLPWLTQVGTVPVAAGHVQKVTYTYAGIEYGNGWFAILAAVLLAAVAVGAVVLGRGRLEWMVVVPVVVGGLSLGDWLSALRGTGVAFPAGVAVSLAGLLLASPAVAALRRARLSGRLAIAAVTLTATGLALLLGALLGLAAPIFVVRAY